MERTCLAVILAAGDGTPNMQNIALAVQEGATAFLSRQFRTLGVFAVVAFLLLLALPAHTEEAGAHWGLRIGRSIAFLAGAVFSGLMLISMRCSPTTSKQWSAASATHVGITPRPATR